MCELRRSVAFWYRLMVSRTIYNSEFLFINCVDNALIPYLRSSVILCRESPLRLAIYPIYISRMLFLYRVDVIENNKHEMGDFACFI